jgi:hypothetical protein
VCARQRLARPSNPHQLRLDVASPPTRRDLPASGAPSCRARRSPPSHFYFHPSTPSAIAPLPQLLPAAAGEHDHRSRSPAPCQQCGRVGRCGLRSNCCPATIPDRTAAAAAAAAAAAPGVVFLLPRDGLDGCMCTASTCPRDLTPRRTAAAAEPATDRLLTPRMPPPLAPAPAPCHRPCYLCRLYHRRR